MARPTMPDVGDPDWGAPLTAAIFDVSDRADAALAAGGGFSGGTTANDIEITVATKGLILRSPGGSRFRITVGNDGALTTTAL